MLIRFNVKNFLSFSEREDGRIQEFSMIAGKVRNKKTHIFDNGEIKLLKFAAVYGANASGKSNLVKALDYMRDIVLFGLPKGHTEKYCKVDIENKNKESYFEIEIMLNHKYYTYGFEVILNQRKFVSEWLVELMDDDREELIFSRDIKNGTYEFGNILKEKGLIDKLEVYAEDIQEDESVLFLSIMNKNKKTLYQQYKNIHIVQDVYKWIKESLDINYPNAPISDYRYMIKNEKMEQVSKLIAAFGTGITNFGMVEVSYEEILEKLPMKIRENLMKDIEDKMIDMRNHKNKVGAILKRY